MPLYFFKCPKCDAERSRVMKFTDVEKAEVVCSCGERMTRDPRPISMSSKETLDNGIMARAVTRYTDAEEVTHQLTEAHEAMRRAK